MSSLSVFCLGDELTQWLRELGEKHDLAALSFHSGQDEGEVFARAELITIAGHTRRLFLMPTALQPGPGMSMNDVKSRPWGWLDVAPGRLVDTDRGRRLLYSVITGEDFETEPVHPSRYVRWLKRRIKREARAGVIGWNVLYGGEARYRNLWHTEAARQLLEQGVAWAQFADGRAQFRPMT